MWQKNKKVLRQNLEQKWIKPAAPLIPTTRIRINILACLRAPIFSPCMCTLLWALTSSSVQALMCFPVRKPSLTQLKHAKRQWGERRERGSWRKRESEKAHFTWRCLSEVYWSLTTPFSLSLFLMGNSNEAVMNNWRVNAQSKNN